MGHIGTTNFNVPRLREMVDAGVPIASVQVEGCTCGGVCMYVGDIHVGDIHLWGNGGLVVEVELRLDMHGHMGKHAEDPPTHSQKKQYHSQ